MPSRRVVVTLGVVALLLFAGCVGVGTDDGDAIDPDDDVAAEPDDTTADAPADGDAGLDEFAASQPPDRHLVRTGEFELRVDDAEAANEDLRELTVERDGFVESSQQRTHDRAGEQWRSQTIVLRIPAESFDEATAALDEIGEVRSAETEAEDVTEQLVDLEARLDNLEGERDRLRELYADANETQDVLAVGRELAEVQEEIERLDARQQALERDVAYSTLTVHLKEDRPEPEADPEWYDTGIGTAFSESVDGVAVTLRALVVGAAYVAPYALVFGTPALGAAALYRYRQQ